MLDLLFSNNEGKHYFLRDICNGTKQRYVYQPPQKLRLNSKQIRRCLDSLGVDVDHKQTTPNTESLIIKNLDLETSSNLRGRAKAISYAFTFKEYMEFSLYDSEIGYYTTNPGIGRDFRTKPMRHTPYYGMWASELLFQLWLKLVHEGTLHSNEPFHIVEGGAGTGIFARDILNYAKSKLTNKDSLRNRFYNNLFYLIIEISPELAKKQKGALIDCDNKYAIYRGDVRHIQDEVAERLRGKGFFISNELPDAFSMHKVRRIGTKLQASIVFPVVKQHKNATSPIKACDLLIRNYLFHDRTLQPEGHLLSKDHYKNLTKGMSKDEINEQFAWEEVWVNANEIEEIRNFIPAHTPFFTNMNNNREYALNTDLRHFQQSSSNLIEAGFKITIDYQETNQTVIKTKDAFRCYPGGVKHGYHILPGTYDITADVNASSLAEEGKSNNWNPIFFGTERMLLGLGSHEAIDHLSCRRMNFKVLIEKKGGGKGENSVPVISMPLTYRRLYIEKCDVLPRIFSNVLEQDNYSIMMTAHNLYAALLDIKYPLTSKFGRKEQKALKKVNQSIHPLGKELKQAIKLSFKSFLGGNSLLKIIDDHNSLDSVDLKKIAHVFDQTKTSDNVDYLAFLITRQVLQIFFYFRDSKPMLPIKIW